MAGKEDALELLRQRTHELYEGVKRTARGTYPLDILARGDEIGESELEMYARVVLAVDALVDEVHEDRRLAGRPPAIPIEQSQPTFYSHPLFDFYRDRHIVVVNGEQRNLTATQTRLLGILVDNENGVVTHTAILHEVCRTDSQQFPIDTVKSHLTHLRKTLGQEDRAGIIETISGRRRMEETGYILHNPRTATPMTPQAL